MADIPNTEYITVKRDENGAVDVFVGGKPAIKYRGVRIYDINYVKDTFIWIQEQNPNITELHVLSSETSAMVGNNPSPEHGRYAWCRVKYKDGQFGGWVFVRARASAPLCALSCAYDCAAHVRVNAAFRRAVFVTAFDNGQNGKNAQSDDLGCIDWSQKLGVHNVGPYRIIVEKVGPNTK
jgi:hypothetical protein